MAEPLPLSATQDPELAARQAELERLHRALEACRRCPAMLGPPVHSVAVLSSIMLIGQAPGTREIEQKRPFCWTAGKTLFRWMDSIGIGETAFRRQVLMSAVCRCFPGKNPKGGDRVPDRDEVTHCGTWWRSEMALLRPRLILPVGKLAITQLMDCPRLDDVVGRQWTYRDPAGWEADIIPLPHSSGASTWFKMEPGRTRLAEALGLIAAHPCWRELLAAEQRDR